jgi:hypothetical protein
MLGSCTALTMYRPSMGRCFAKRRKERISAGVLPSDGEQGDDPHHGASSTPCSGSSNRVGSYARRVGGGLCPCLRPLDSALRWATPPQGHLQRVGDELGAQVIGDRPADDAPTDHAGKAPAPDARLLGDW